MAPFFIGIAGAIKGQAGFGLGRKAKSKSLVKKISTFTSPGSISIPAGSTSVVIKAHGVRAGTKRNPEDASGGYVEGQFNNLLGKTLNISFAGGGTGYGGFTNFLGGNYAGVFDGPVNHANSLIIAGGGGAAGAAGGSFPRIGGAGGGTTGGTGLNGTPIIGSGTPGTGGSGGSQVSGGSKGSDGPSSPSNTPGTAGSALQGGNGSTAELSPSNIHSGSGGGGYYGGGGGGVGYRTPTEAGAGSGGGGGSSYVHPSAISTTNTQGGSLYSNGFIEIEISEFL